MGWGPSHLCQPHPKPRLSLLGGGAPTIHEPRNEKKHGTPIIEMEKLRPREESCLASGDSSLVWASQSPS